MRQRLAEAMGKHRSFVSQISNPAYQVPIPPHHVVLIFEVCRFSAQQRAAFLEAYARAHPGRLALGAQARHDRKMTLALPDLGNPAKNRQLDKLIVDIVYRLTLLLSEGRLAKMGKARNEELHKRSR
jgi:hypothetical protein